MVNLFRNEISAQAGKSAVTIYLAGDLGKSACKFIYWINDGLPQALWLGADVAEGVADITLRKFETAGDILDATWLSVQDKNILVGNSALGYSSSFAANKVRIAAYQVAAALGLAAMSIQASHYNAVMSLTVPFNEFRYRHEIEAQLQEISQGFSHCGREQRFTPQTNFYPEGTGLYLLHRQSMERSLETSLHQRVIVLMMGHRNLSMLVFDEGKLNSNASQTSDRLGFWQCFMQDATAAGIRETDFPSLLAAVASGQEQQVSVVEGGVKDFAIAAAEIRQGYLKRLDTFCRDQLMKLLVGTVQPQILLGGGVAYVLMQELQEYFEQLGNSVYFSDVQQSHLLELVRQTQNAHSDPARRIRFADCYGLYRALLGKVQKRGI
jgi:hypothetical protein